MGSAPAKRVAVLRRSCAARQPARPETDEAAGHTDQNLVLKWLHAELPGSSLPSEQSQKSSLM